ncbi:hypothetical protein HQN60_12650 [Deefgea piscis]|uniref:Uncharacterized protein n=1 Tax=Deefgea piscis TaxID=2739061 RepID=A0A6M8T0F0_9NEIS|nr:hypothetical protein [Deefgea piscis]QKJ67487.1 hypothetical protein HQN60_12650 [Deefgea piscis]
MSLKIVQPINLSDAALSSSSVPENDYPVWAAATAYIVGQRVIRTQTHRIYERVAAGTTAALPEVDKLNWIDVGPTNRWAMFDQVNSTKTVKAGSIVVEITPAKVVNTVALLNVEAETVLIELIDLVDGLVYSRQIQMLDNGIVTSWWQWCFAPIKRKSMVILTDLPAYGTAKIRLTITNSAGNVTLGTAIVGAQVEFGEGIEMGAKAGIQDFSRKERDQWGNFVLTERNFAKRGVWQMKVLNTQIDGLMDYLSTLRAKPCLWIGAEQYNATVIYGFFKEFDIVIAYANLSECNLEIEGLT